MPGSLTMLKNRVLAIAIRVAFCNAAYPREAVYPTALSMFPENGKEKLKRHSLLSHYMTLTRVAVRSPHQVEKNFAARCASLSGDVRITSVCKPFCRKKSSARKFA
jgi:hypothetical protein